MTDPSHKDCVPRQDYDALMQHFNNLRRANYALAMACREAQDKVRQFEDLFSNA